MLRAKFGEVRIPPASAGLPLQAHIIEDPKTGKRRLEKHGPHEQYEVCCPVCGDNRFRLQISYRWLTIWPGWGRLTHLVHCFNEQCEVWRKPFWEPLLPLLEGTESLLAVWNDPVTQAPEGPRPDVAVEMPGRTVPLHELPPDHPACQFLASKYNGITAEYLGRYYGAVFCGERDVRYRMARNRIIFPLSHNGVVTGWQGRTILPPEQEGCKWYISPGFRKTPYNIDQVEPTQVPIICEGITSAIASGPSGLAVFGKSISNGMAEELARKYRTAIVAIDPETFVPDLRTQKQRPDGTITSPAREYAKELCSKLNQYFAVPVWPIQWPESVLELARRKVSGEDVKVPDPADIGLQGMYTLLTQQVPETHRCYFEPRNDSAANPTAQCGPHVSTTGH
jgi:hypothetical protein